jgi:hypothetical protein
MASMLERVKTANPNIFSTRRAKDNHDKRVEARAQRLAYEAWLLADPSLSQALKHPKLPPALKRRLEELEQKLEEAAEELDDEGMFAFMDGLGAAAFGPEGEY